ncbi:PadR family transcriptional regulator [Lysinibacter cavernae]|uniref:DNA-binding PadR family transcriptional regulator n=1 Tax=Lysinibacter cavernae TaxID=1640652 RepID=A0A7X5R3H3_9MICO|nr:PadR family transcriptional regulator [Lysinibacter cavernae]NIH54978.1 DNA-binding PadR family transcriptional regulator [Lysinibacter cavernae]
MSTLSPTVYAILGLLAAKEWTTYEIAFQMTKNMGPVWPRAERQLYDDPKKLVAKGYASCRKEMVGKRQRTLYSITDAGRVALAEYLATEPAPAMLEFEGMLRVFNSGEGSVESLRGSIMSVAEQAEDGLADVRIKAQALLGDEATFPERAHSTALGLKYLVGYFAGIYEWAQWALDEIASWETTSVPSPEVAARTHELLNSIANHPPLGSTTSANLARTE